MKHKHRIVPGHMGGKYTPDNVIELTVEEHAEAHRLLYEQYSREKDKIAWLALSGQIGKEEARILAVKYAMKGNTYGKFHKGKPKSEEHRKKLSIANIGHKVTKETRQKQSLVKKGNSYGSGNKGKSSLNKGKPRSDDTKYKISNKLKGKPWSEKRRSAQMRRNENE